MDALLYIYKFQVITFLVLLITVASLLIPKRFLGTRKYRFLAIAIEIIVLTISFLSIKKPIEIEKSYVHQVATSDQTIGEYANKRNFFIGVAVNNYEAELQQSVKYFNSITPANALKWGKLIEKNKLELYDFSLADSIVNNAIKNNMRVRGHVLVWGRAASFFKSPNLDELLKDVPEDKMKDTLTYYIENNIKVVLNHFRGRIKNWDCVNEPLEVFGGKYHKNIFYKYLGKDYISHSFRYANKIDPEVELYLNEQFDTYDSEKAESFLNVVTELVKDGVPIHGVGIQSHVMFTIPELQAFKTFLDKISALGLKIEITELDARLRLFTKFDDPYQAQGDFYKEITKICVENPTCQGITIWGLEDGDNWYNSLGVFNYHRPNNPNLFDEDMNMKPAYYGVLEALKD